MSFAATVLEQRLMHNERTMDKRRITNGGFREGQANQRLLLGNTAEKPCLPRGGVGSKVWGGLSNLVTID